MKEFDGLEPIIAIFFPWKMKGLKESKGRTVVGTVVSQ